MTATTQISKSFKEMVKDYPPFMRGKVTKSQKVITDGTYAVTIHNRFQFSEIDALVYTVANQHGSLTYHLNKVVRVKEKDTVTILVDAKVGDFIRVKAHHYSDVTIVKRIME